MNGFYALLLLSLTTGADLQTLSGKKLTGDLVGLDRQTVILRAADGAETRQPIAEVLLIDLGGPAPAPPKGSYFEVELTDGTILRCNQVALKGTEAELTVLPEMALTLPLNTVFTILRDAHDPKVHLAWQKFVAQRGQFDKVAV